LHKARVQKVPAAAGIIEKIAASKPSQPYNLLQN
jgi:hypothetical protein